MTYDSIDAIAVSTIAVFTNQAHMTIMLPTAIHASHVSFSLHFLTTAPNGTLLRLGDPTATADFVRLFTVGGRVMSSFRLGGGTTTVMSTEVFDDGQWHVIQASLSNHTLTLMIDDVLLVGCVMRGCQVTLTVAGTRATGRTPGWMSCRR